ncbi:hypothetical protein [Enterobacter ludwigii]
MFKSTVLDAKESKAVIGGKQGPYGECVFMFREWYRVDANNAKKTAPGNAATRNN